MCRGKICVCGQLLAVIAVCNAYVLLDTEYNQLTTNVGKEGSSCRHYSLTEKV